MIASGHTDKGIQTVTFADGSWWFGCYGKPAILLRADENFKFTGQWEFNASVGIVGLGDGNFLVALNKNEKGRGNLAMLCRAKGDEKKGAGAELLVPLWTDEPEIKNKRFPQ